MIFNIIMLICMYPVLPIMYFVLKNLSKPKKNIILGVTLPSAFREDEKVLDILSEYKTVLRKAILILAFVPLICFFIPYMSINLTIYMTWLLFVIIVPYLVYIKYHLKINEIKKENGLLREEIMATVDTKVAAIQFNKVNKRLFIPPIIFSILPIIASINSAFGNENSEYSYVYIIIYSINAILTISFLPINQIIYHQRAEIVDNNSDLTITLTRIRRRNWSKSLLISAWLTGVFSLLFWWFIQNGLMILIITGIYSIILLYYILRVEFKTRAMQEKLTQNSGTDMYIDDDKSWILGLFYYNPNDKHIMINDRIGMGTTVNLAKPVGKFLTMLSIICILLMPFIGIWVMVEEFTPISVKLSNENVTIEHTRKIRTLQFDDIESIKIINTLPKYYKIIGSSMDNLLKGTFVAEGYGEVKLYLNPKKAPFILIKTSENTYILGLNDSQKTLEVYDSIVTLKGN